MSFLAIIKLTDDDRIAKYEELDTASDAQDHVTLYHGLFTVPTPNAPWSHWRFDRVSKSVRIDPPPPEPVEPESDVLLAIRDLADDIGPVSVAKLEARMGPRRT